METVNDTAMHVTETKTLCSSLICPKSKSEEITKEKEEELLYGNSEDGDEEDALSDDSIRLRVSDDEADLDEPSAMENMNNDETTESESTNMELGSDVSAKDTSQQKIALRRENLSNGILTVDENEKSRVNQEEELSRDDFTADTVPRTENFYGVADRADYCNGDSGQADKNKSFHGGSKTGKQGNRNPMVDYLRRHRNSLSRQSHLQASKFVTNSYNNRYYNKNTHYGRGKGSGRGFNVHVKESFGQDSASDGKYSPRVFSSGKSPKENDNPQTTEITPSNIKIEDNTDNQADSNSAESVDTDTNHAVQSEMNDSFEKRESCQEDKKEFSKIDNVETAPNCVDSKDKTSVNNQANEVTSLEDSTADTRPNHETNVNVKSEVNDLNVSVESDDTLIADDANDIAENFGEEEKDESLTEIESKSSEEEPKVNSNESKNEVHEVDKMDSVEKINEDVAAKKQDERTTDTISALTERSEVEEASEADLETTEKETEAVLESSDAVSKEPDEIETTAQIPTNDCHKEDEDKSTEKSPSDPSEPDRQLVSSSEQIPRPDEQSAVVSQNKPEVTEKQSTYANPEQIMKDSQSVVTDDSETNEKSVNSSGNVNISPEPKISEIEDSIADLPDEKDTSSDDEGEGNNVTIVHSSLKRASTEFLDEMELSKRMRIQRKKLSDSSECIATKLNDLELVSPNDNVSIDEKTDKDNGSVVNPVTNNIPDIKSDMETETSVISNTVVETSSTSPKANEEKPTEPVLVDGNDDKEKIDDCEVIEVPVKRKQKRIRRSLQNVQDTVVSQEDTQEKENVRQKRRTAKNAEEIIRKEFLGNSDSESNDSAEKFVVVNYNKTNINSRAASPPTLKRNHVEEDEKVEPKLIKKLKQDFEVNGEVRKIESITQVDKVQTLQHVRNFFRRDNSGRLAKLKQEELEELLIQKVVETITMRDEIGKLREQAKISERNQEATRLKCQQLSKQIKDFEMVLNRYHSDRRSNPDKTVVPIKINRSVGLQVNFVTDHGIQNLRQLGQTQKPATPTVNGVSLPQRSEPSPNVNPVIKRTVKIRSPRRQDPVIPASSSAPTTVPSPIRSQPIITNITPAALVVAKSVQDTRPSVTTTVQQTNLSQLISSNQTILLNGLTNTPVRQATMQISKTTNNSDLIDLTQEEDKTKTTVIPQNAILTNSLTEVLPNVTNVANIPQRYHTVIQTIPGSVTINTPSGIRVVQPSSQPTPTALVNNMNAPRLAYVMQGAMGAPRQVVITSTSTPIRPAPDNQNRPVRATFPISGTITNGTVRVIPTTTTATLQVCKHPAALPESINPPGNPAWKLPPPAPSLKISKVANGIVLSWNMALSDKFADIASYQLYAYQEVSGIPPSSTLWKKVGDVRALPLPMACTLTQFSEGNNYYFAVRAVDRHSRLGQYSQPGNISL